MRSNGLVLALSLSLAVPAGTRAGGQSPAQSAAGAPFPDAATLAMHAALEQILMAKASQITGLPQTPNGTSSTTVIKDGAAFGDTIKMGLVLIQETTIAQFAQAQLQLAALKTASPAVREAELAKIRDLAVEARDAYREMRAIERDDLKGDMNGEARGFYDSTMRDADTLDKAGRHAEADALREQAAQSRWGAYLKARQRFFKAAGAHPLLAARLGGGATDLFLDQTYFFNKVLESAVPRSGTGVSVATLLTQMDDHIDRAIDQLKAQQARIANMTTWQELWELGGPAFEATQRQATGVGGDLGKGLVDAVTATHAGATAVSAYDNAWWETTLSIVQVGSMIIPVAGPFISAGITGIQVYKSGNDFVIALIDVKNATGSSAVTGQEAVVEAKDRSGAAAGSFVVNIAMVPAEIPGLIDAMKAGKVIVKRGTATLTRVAADAKGALTGTEDAAKAARAAEDAKAVAGGVKTATGVLGDAEFVASLRKEFGDAVADGVAKAQELGVPRDSIEQMVKGARFDETASKGVLGQAAFEELRAISANARRVIERIGEVDRFIKDARAAGVPEDVINAAIARAKAKNTVTGWGTTLQRELNVAEANAGRATVVIAEEQKGAEGIADFTAADYKDWAAGMPPTRTVTMNPVDISGLQAKVRLLVKNPKLAALMGVRLTDEEVRILFQEVLPRPNATRTWVYLDREEGGLVRAFDDQFYTDLDKLKELFPDQFAAKANTFGPPTPVATNAPPATTPAGTPPAQPPARTPREPVSGIDPSESRIFGGPKFDANGFSFKGVSPTGVSSLTEEELIRALKQLYNDPRGVSRAVRAAVYVEVARRIAALDGAAAAVARTATGNVPNGTTKNEKDTAPPPTPPRTPTGSNTSTSAPPKPTGGLTPEEEKRASDAMLKDEVGMAPKTATGGSVCGTEDCGRFTIDPNNVIHLTLPDGVTTYPGLMTPTGFGLFPPGTVLSPDAPPLTPTFVAPFIPLPLGHVTVNADGSVTYGSVPISGLSGTFNLRDDYAAVFGRGFVFTPPSKDKTGPVTGGDSGSGNSIGGGGLSYAPPVPPGPTFGWGESESTTTDPVDLEHRTTPNPGDPGLVELGGFSGDPLGCCFSGVQSLMLDFGSPITVEPARVPIADVSAAPRWPWSLRGVTSALRALLDGMTSPASVRALQIANLPIALPPALTTRAASNRGGGVAPGAPLLKTFITSLGTSQGDAFDLKILNEGLSAIRVSGSGVVVEPLKREAQERMQKEMAKLVRGNAATRRVEGYCLAFGLRPPTPGMLFQIAAPDIQQKFAPARAVLGAGQRLSAAGLLHPDSAVKSYVESIKQYAIWTKVENWDLKRFAESLVEKTKANAAASKRNWTREMETALMSAVPGRWRDIQAILQEAQAHPAGGP